MDLFSVSLLLGAGLVGFILGSFYFYLELKRFRKATLDIVHAKPSDPVNISKENSILSDLNQFICQLKILQQQSKNQAMLLQTKLDKVTSHVQGALLYVDEKDRILFYNSQAQTIFDLSDIEAEKYLNEVVRSPDVRSVFRNCLKTEQVLTQESTFEKKNQYFKSVFQVTAMPVIHPDLKIKQGWLMFYDQTDIKHFKQAEIDFVSNVSHELRTPLTSVQGYVEILLQDLSQNKWDQFEKFLRIILRNCSRMNLLIEDLLNLSYLDSKTQLNKKKLSTRQITSAVLKKIKIGRHKLEVSYSSDNVIADPRWVEIVLYNLLDNACRYCEQGSLIQVHWEKSSKRDGVTLRVKDNGDGIPEKYQNRVFERFFRLDSSRSRDKGGTGVGLALVKQSVEKHNGFVKVISSSAQGGSEFVCEFPSS